MTRTRRVVLTLIVVCGLSTAAASAAAEAPAGVSPGALDRVATVRSDCPTFSWEAVDDASFYELVVYAVPEGADLSAELALTTDDEVLYTRLPGGAITWTPEVGRCFAPAGAYVWFVRVVLDEGGELQTGEWSQGLYFTVATAPSAEEVRQALDVLQRYLASGEGGNRELAALLSGADAGGDADEGVPPRSRSATPKGTAPDTLTGAAAIRASMPDLTGATFGVYGITNSTTDGSLGVVGEATGTTGEVHGLGGITASPTGAGVVAYNTADGPDLMLVSDTGGSAWLTETGLVRDVPGAATFNFENSNASGSMMLQLDGVDVVTTLTDRDTLAGLTCASGQPAEWNGSAWACAEDGDSLAALGCTAGQVAKWSGSAWTCAPDEDSTYSDGYGLQLTGGTVFSVDPTVIQRRVVSPCAVGQSIRVVNEDGSVVCEPDDDTDTLGGLACGLNQIVKWNGSSWICAPDESTTYSPGNQLDLVGTTFNVLEGAGSGLDADTLDGHDTGFFAPSVHTHLGQTWTGSATSGLRIDNSLAGTSFAIDGRATAATGGTYGVYGKSSSNEGTGVWGWADSATGTTYGVQGLSSSDEGVGVYGEASHSLGITFGVYGKAAAYSGAGVVGENTATSGRAVGVAGLSHSESGDGVAGSNLEPTGTTRGVYGRVNSVDGYGVYGNNSSGGIDIMAGGSGDIAQTLEGNGLVKAAAYVDCSSSPSVIQWFNNVPGGSPVTTSNLFLGSCIIELGFNPSSRFWTISPVSNHHISCFYQAAIAEFGLICSGVRISDASAQDWSGMLHVY